jgi:hypothetical protein
MLSGLQVENANATQFELRNGLALPTVSKVTDKFLLANL